MEPPHLDEELVERFLAGQTTREENRAAVRHLLRGCHVCSARLRRRCRPGTEAEYDQVISRVIASRAGG